jgi:peptidoglycan/LPS O-acetylase OafA/YrhL
MGSMVVLVLLLLLAAALGILGVVVKVALVIVLSVIFAIVLLGAITYYYVRHRVRRFVQDTQRRQVPGGPERGYPASGTKGPGPQLPE